MQTPLSSMGWWLVLPAFLASAAALGLSVILMGRKGASTFHRSVATVVGATGLIQIGNGLGLVDVSHSLEWRRVGLVFELLFPAALQYVGLVFLRSRSDDEEKGARWRARAVTGLAVVFAIVGLFGPFYVQATADDGRSVVTLGSFGRVAYVFIVLSLTLGLAQLEHIIRVSRDPLRYQIKYVLIGLGGLAGYGIYQASQLLMVPVWNSEFVLVGALASLISLGLIAFGFGRLRLRDVRAKVYVSPQLLYGSVTFLVIGLYLLSVGLIGEVIRLTGEPLSVGVSILVVFVSILALVIVLFSRAAHAYLRQFIARHFYRSKYDYRAKWLEVTEAFGLCVSREEVLDRLIELLGRTFGAAHVSIWIRCEADGEYHQVRSVNTEPAPRPLDETHPLIANLMKSDDPVEVDKLRASSEQLADTHYNEALMTTHAILCVPIRFDRQLISFITLSRQFQGARYGQDDFDLLRAIAHHAGMLLSLAKMAEEKSAASELEALHRFSAFCLHDLKNLAAKLSLVMQNAQVHGEEPAFHQSAMRTVAGTVQKMMALITKLSLKSGHSGVAEAVDVTTLIAEAISSMNGELRVAANSIPGQAVTVRIVRDQMQQVLLNLILNAQQELKGTRARSEEPDISIDTEQRNASVIITITDRGPGIPADRLQTLFQPFKSTKSNGLGLGLYQCKRIIEEHGGTIRLRSEVGRGTQVRIELPAVGPMDSVRLPCVLGILFLSSLFVLALQSASLATPFGGSLTPKKSPAQLQYETGRMALDKSDTAGAEAAFKESLRGDPTRVDALLGLAHIAITKGRPDEAEAQLRRALILAPQNAIVQTAWGRYLVFQKKFESAEAAFKKASDLNPMAVTPLMDLASLYISAMNRPQDAIAAYRRVLKLNPKDPGAHYALGTALEKSGQTKQGRAEWQEAARLAPDNPTPFVALGTSYAKNNEISKALEAWSQALKVQPDLVQARLARADLFAATGEDMKALGELGEAAKLDPKLPFPYLRMGMIHERRNRLAEAEKAYLKAIELDPAEAIAYNNLAWMATERKTRLEEARTWAEKAVELQPSVAEFQDTLAWVYWTRGDPRRAVSLLKKATASKTPPAGSFYHLGVIYQTQEQNRGAIEAFQRALELQPNFPQAQDARRRLQRLQAIVSP